MYATVFNPSDGPVVTSDQGAVLGGGEWGSVKTTSDAAESAIAADQLIKIRQVDAEDRDSLSRPARLAMGRTDELQARAEQLEGLDKAALVKVAVSVGALEKDAEEPLRADLERDLVEGDYDLPKPRAAKQASTTTPAK